MTDNPPALAGQPAVMTATVQIVRANTGKVEEYKLVFTPEPEEPKPQETPEE